MHAIDVHPERRACIACKKTKPPCDFYAHGSGMRRTCGDCYSEAVIARRKADREHSKKTKNPMRNELQLRRIIDGPWRQNKANEEENPDE